jgi:hypothetical protein
MVNKDVYITDNKPTSAHDQTPCSTASDTDVYADSTNRHVAVALLLLLLLLLQWFNVP